MNHAFSEFYPLLSKLQNPISAQDTIVQYLCALVSELTYYHVPQIEIDQHKRAKIIPCEAYRNFVNSRTPSDVQEDYMQNLDFPNSFVIANPGVIAVGLFARNYLFVGFRGTAILYDWKINIRSSLVQVNSCSHNRRYVAPFFGSVHSGFFDETKLIVPKIHYEMNQQNRQKAIHIFFTGHSLGGAVAALAESCLRGSNTSACIFGTPRYCDRTVYCSSFRNLPMHVERFGDIVPSVPPKWMGYADHPYQYDTSCTPVRMSIQSTRWRHYLWRLALFLGKRLKPHSMEGYRQELGRTAKAKNFDAQLVPHPKVTDNKGSIR